MVLVGRVWFAKQRNYMKSNFRDSLKIFVRAGAGGHGLPKFGGVGGRGGDIKVVGKENVTLSELHRQNKSKRFQAPNGRNSSHNFILGPPGELVKIEVPVGVTVYTESGKKLGEINAEGEHLRLAKGGIGGNPKNGFLGKKGEEQSVILDLKLIADVGLVGFPNAGKSTLLKAISHAKPRIASYPFTTVRPNVGVIKYKDLRQISMADLPGLIEGAYANRGMGHRFLKHVERTKLLLLVVDINGFQLSPEYPHRTCLENILLLNKELELYNKSLIEKPAMLVINKMDTENAAAKLDEFKDKLKHLPDICNDYPEEMRSENFIKFHEIMATSLKEDQDDVQKLKLKLRNLIDVFSELELENVEKNSSLYSSVRHNLQEKGPKLV